MVIWVDGKGEGFCRLRLEIFCGCHDLSFSIYGVAVVICIFILTIIWARSACGWYLWPTVDCPVVFLVTFSTAGPICYAFTLWHENKIVLVLCVHLMVMCNCCKDLCLYCGLCGHGRCICHHVSSRCNEVPLIGGHLQWLWPLLLGTAYFPWLSGRTA